MEAVAATRPPTEPGRKLAIEKFSDGTITCLKFTGTIDEGFDGKKLGSSIACDTLVLDVGGVKKISSFGIREWVDFVGAAKKSARAMILIECAPKVVDQLNMVANFTGGGRVFSFYAPFRCDYCDSDHRVLLQLDKDFEVIKSMKMAERPCPACHEGMYFDEDGTTYFSYVIGQEKFELEPQVAAFLASKLDYAVAESVRKLRVDKVVEGRATYLRLAGDLDRTFPREKLAEGLEGTVVIDLAALGRIEPAGAAEWRSFVQMVTPLVEQLYLVAVQPAFLDKLGAKDDLGAKAQVLSCSLPYTCKACGTTSPQMIDVAEHHDVLRFATAPELRCATCKATMQCAAGETTMTIVPGLPKPTPSPELVKSLGVLRERALSAAQTKWPASRASQPITPLPAPAVAPPRVSIWTLVAIGLALAGLALGGLLFFRTSDKKDLGPYGVGPLFERSASERPAWIDNVTLGSVTTKTTPDKGLSSVGVSSLSASQEEAEDEALEAASEGNAFELARRQQGTAWFSNVPGIYEGVRVAKLAAVARDPASTQARREVREARHTIAVMLRAAGITTVMTGRYRETYDTPEGKRYVAFMQVPLFPDDITRLATAYSTPQSALGATVVTLFPELGWRYRLDRGAIVIGLDDGPLKELGIAVRYVILSIDGRPVTDAAAFAKIANEELATLREKGGTLRLAVQADDGAPREFSTAIPGRVVEPPPPPPHGPRGSGAPQVPNTGNVNVWDRYGGGKGSGRDDPTQ